MKKLRCAARKTCDTEQSKGGLQPAGMHWPVAAAELVSGLSAA